MAKSARNVNYNEYTDKRILVLGARGLVGSAVVRQLTALGFKYILSPPKFELDLMNQQSCLEYFHKNKIDWIVMAAAKVGGIHANDTYRADFILQNLLMQSHLFEAALESKIQKLLFLGSSCIYPKSAPQPLKEEYLLTGPLEPTNEPYAIAKIAGLKTTENIRRQYGLNFFSAMPTNLFGIYDNFHPQNSHVIPGLIARMHESMMKQEKVFKIWGSGRPRREFLYVDDLASACVHLLCVEEKLPDLINVGTGEDISIAELAQLIKDLMGYSGSLENDPSMPDGMMEKRLDVSRITELGWKAQISLKEGLKRSIDFYRSIYK